MRAGAIHVHESSRAVVALALMSAIVFQSACIGGGKSDARKTDTTVVASISPPSPSDSSAPAIARTDSTGTDSLASAAMDSVRSVAPLTPSPAVSGSERTSDSAVTSGSSVNGGADNVASASAPSDSGSVRLYPAAPRRGGVVVAIAKGVVSGPVSCRWKGAPLPCYTTSDGIRALIPLPAEMPSGTYTLVIRGINPIVTRQIAVADHDFGRELIFLDAPHYALLRQGKAIARDARRIRQILASETPEQRWAGEWRDPSHGTKSSPYGIDRFYFLASDSARAVRLGTSLKTSGSFGLDTAQAKPGSVPGWRHTGIDIPLKRGAPVRAAAAGNVVDVSNYILTGNTVVIDHGQGIHTVYFHLDSATVRPGDVVRTGTPIGRVGATGLTTGPHLHYGVYIHGLDVDPVLWHAIPSSLLSNPSQSNATRKPR